MKSFRIFTALAIILFFFFASCECNLPDDTIRFSELPEATSEGLHTFGCIVDGRRWAVGSYEDLRGYAEPHSFTLEVDGHHLTKLKQIRISVRERGIGSLVTGVNYELSSNLDAGISGHTENRVCTFTDEEGWVRFSRYDLPTWDSPGVIAGEFEATLTGECGERKITRGRFDVVVIHQ